VHKRRIVFAKVNNYLSLAVEGMLAKSCDKIKAYIELLEGTNKEFNDMLDENRRKMFGKFLEGGIVKHSSPRNDLMNFRYPKKEDEVKDVTTNEVPEVIEKALHEHFPGEDCACHAYPVNTVNKKTISFYGYVNIPEPEYKVGDWVIVAENETGIIMRKDAVGKIISKDRTLKYPYLIWLDGLPSGTGFRCKIERHATPEEIRKATLKPLPFKKGEGVFTRFAGAWEVSEIIEIGPNLKSGYPIRAKGIGVCKEAAPITAKNSELLRKNPRADLESITAENINEYDLSEFDK